MGWRLTALLDWLFAKLGIPLLRVVAPVFFDSRYLTGRHFAEGGEGWRWVSRSLLTQRFLRYNRHVPWPASPTIIVGDPRKIDFHVDDLNNFQTFGCYFQSSAARIVIGRGTYIAPNTGLITANHDPLDPDRHLPGADIVLGEACWIGMNVTIMPGVTLGPHTAVGAGAVVTKSFPEGWVVIGGVPAVPIRRLHTETSASATGAGLSDR